MRYNHFSMLPEQAFQRRPFGGMTLEGGGGGIPIVSDVLDFAGDVVSDVGSWVDDNIIQPVIEHPLETAALVAATVFAPELLPAMGEVGGEALLADTALATEAGGMLGAEELIGAGGDIFGLTEAAGAPILDLSIPFDPAAYEQFSGVSGALSGLGDLASAGFQTLTQNPLQTLRMANTANNLYNYLTADTPTRPAGMGGSNLAGTSLLNPLGAGSPTSTASGLPGSLEASTLAAAPVTSKMPNPMDLLKLKQLYPQLANVDNRLLAMLTGKQQAAPNYYTYGALSGDNEPQSLASDLSITPSGREPSPGYPSKAADTTTEGRERQNFPSYLQSPLSQLGMKYLAGGQYMAKGGQPQEFRTGTPSHYVEGPGDGQSDDIPAMLADGEYVFDADTVAALGNGSNKAGAAVLDRMRENVRKHKRSAKHDKIPPKAKSPLAYMKG